MCKKQIYTRTGRQGPHVFSPTRAHVIKKLDLEDRGGDNARARCTDPGVKEEQKLIKVEGKVKGGREGDPPPPE